MARSVVVDDLARLRWAMEPAAHPAEGLVAYVVSGPNRETDQLSYDLHVSQADGQDRFVESESRSPRWSPDGRCLAFAQWREQRWVPAVKQIDGPEWDIAPPPGDVVDMRWSPDGQTLLVAMATPKTSNEQALPYRVDTQDEWADGTETNVWIIERAVDPIQIASGLANTSSADWGPDSDRVVIISQEGVDRDLSLAAGLWIWSVSASKAHNLVPPTRPIHAVSWSPDGSQIAYLMASRDNANASLLELWVHDLESKTSNRLGVDLDRSVGKPVRGDDERGVGPPILQWGRDSKSVLALYADGGLSRLARFATDGSFEHIELGEQCVLEFSAGQEGIAYSWSDPVTPGEISWFDRDERESRQVTSVGAELLSEVDLAPTIRVSTVASDGVEVEGWLTLPRVSGGAPLVLQVHGGPHYAVGQRFSFDSQRLAAHGFAVLRSNPRGSQGYGQEFADGNLGDWGGRDLEDLVELVDEVVSTAGLDGDRVAVVGESYGGYMAAWAAASAERFAAAVVENGIADFLSSAGGVIGPTFWHSELGGAPWDATAIYLERSPITRLDRISIPVLVLHCEDDQTCAIEQGEAIFEGLRQLGADVEFWRVPGEGHFFNVFGRLGRRIERTRVLDHFLISHLEPTHADRKPAGKEKES